MIKETVTSILLFVVACCLEWKFFVYSLEFLYGLKIGATSWGQLKFRANYWSNVVPSNRLRIKCPSGSTMMTEVKSEYDASIIIGLLVVFALPLTLLLPGFSVWNVVPKVRVTRFHILAQQLDWSHLNAAIIALLAIFFCLYLEIRKRK